MILAMTCEHNREGFSCPRPALYFCYSCGEECCQGHLKACPDCGKAYCFAPGEATCFAGHECDRLLVEIGAVA